MRHHLAAGQEVEELVGAAELDVGLDRRPSRRPASAGRGAPRPRSARCAVEPLGEVVALEQARDGRSCAPAARCRRRSSFAEPFAVEAHLGPLGVEDLHRLLEVALGVRVDLLVGRGSAAPPSARTGRRSASCSRRRSGRRCGPRPGRRASAGAGSPAERGRPATVTSIPSFTRNGRPSFSFSSRPPAGRTSTAFRVSCCDAHRGARLPRFWRSFGESHAVPSGGASASSDSSPSSRFSSRSGHGVVHLRSSDRGRCQDPATRPGAAADAGEHLRLRRERPHGAHDPARLAGADHRPVDSRSRRG